MIASEPNLIADECASPPAPAIPRRLRLAEKCFLAFFTYTAAACWIFSLTLNQRLTILVLNALAAAVIVALSQAASSKASTLLPLRDWLPCVLIVLAYRESGLFIQPDVTQRLDVIFEAWDRAILTGPWFQAIVAFGSPWLRRVMELAYLLVYPFVPLGFAAVYFSKRGARNAAERNEKIDRYWSAILLAVLTSYALFPFFPLTPPRVLFHDFPIGTASTALRHLNALVLGSYSVQACIFPSGHVAGAVATALAVRSERPRLGLLFLLAAVLISVSTFYGRYHYCADALAGAAIGVGAFIAARIGK